MAKKGKIDVNYKPIDRTSIPVKIENIKQLLCDDFLLAMAIKWDQLFYRVQFANGIVQKHGSPIMDAKESGSAWLNVIKENNLYRLWYMSYRPGGVSYAESNDGIHWEKPKLGIIDIGGSKQNNVVFDGGFESNGGEFGNVFHDPYGDANEQYKMVYADNNERGMDDFRREGFAYNATHGTLRGASSPDGIHWLRYPENFLGKYPDSQNVGMWDSTLEKYVIYHRTQSEFGGIDSWKYNVQSQRRGRAIGRMESDNFRNFASSTSEIALAPDLVDGLNTDIYNPAYTRHPDNPNVHYLFPSFYRHYEGTFEVQVCTSRDNKNWTRICRDTFIPLGKPREFDCFMIMVGPGIVKVDDTTWALYYRSVDGPHSGALPSKFDNLDYQPKDRVSRVTFKEDRVIGIEAGKTKGHFSTRNLAFEGNELIVNSEPLGSDAELKVQLLSSETNEAIPGYDFESCEPIKSDGTRTVVKWKGKNGLDSNISRKSVRLHFNMQSTRIYAFQFRG